VIAGLAARLMRRRVADRLRDAREREGRAPDACNSRSTAYGA